MLQCPIGFIQINMCIYSCDRTVTNHNKIIIYAITYFLFVQQKLEAIQVYVSELLQLHEMLIEAMDQMEKEANKKFIIFGGKAHHVTTDGQSNEQQLSLFIYLFLSFKDYENKC